MIWWIVASLCAFYIKGLCGFANTLIFTSILSFGNNNINISPVELLLGYPTNIILAFKERKAINVKNCILLAALVIAGSIPGIFFLKNTDSTVIKILFGFVIIAIGIEMYIREMKPKKTKQSKLVLLVIGLLSGVLCGLYGIGALLGAYISRVTDDTKAFKANICMVFAIENTFRIALYFAWGIFDMAAVKQVLVLAPVMLLGLFLGMLSSRFINDKIVKKLVILLLIVSGVLLIINQL